MRATCHDRSFLISCTYKILAAFLIWSMAVVVPPTARAAALPLGLATGSKEAHIAIDGKQWAALPASSRPIYEGTMVRTGKGAAAVRLKGGTQLELQPHTLISLSGSRMAPVVKIAVGRVLFRAPAASRAVLVTPSVRYQTKANSRPEGAAIVKASTPAPSRPDLVGEIAVTSLGGSRLGVRQGTMIVNPVNDPGHHIIKAGQGVYIPQVGNRDPDFSAMLAQALPGAPALSGNAMLAQALSGNAMLAQALPGAPAPSGLPVDAIPVYGADGKSVGYITADGSFTSSPSITPDLQNPVPDDTIPPDANIPPGATPIFTAAPMYAGYILNDQLVAYIPLGGGGMAGVGGGAGVGTGAEIATGLLTTVLLVGGGTAGGYFAANNGDGNGKASPSVP